jgi:hypothetical protein
VISVSETIDRPPSVVFKFYAEDHLQNHPRWDPMMQLRQLTEGPIGVGTRFHRRHTRIGVPVEGTMDVVEFDLDAAFGVVIRDVTPHGTLEVHSRATFASIGGGRTKLAISIDVPGAETTMDPTMVERSLARIKALIEAEPELPASP